MKEQGFSYAPIIIPTLCRYEHFVRCVESLSRCVGAEYTELFIGLDYPTKKSHWGGYNKISEYVDTITGFKSVNIYRREENFGSRRNSLDLRKKVAERFDRYISTEDDNEFSLVFLEYMNKGLELYKDNLNVVAICGYAYPFDYCTKLDGYSYNAYPIQGFCAWGTGYWIKKNESGISAFVNPNSAYQLIHSWSLVYKLFRKKQHITVHRLLFRHEIAYGDLMWRAYCVLNNAYCIFPLVSKVRNYGFDGSGLNCKVDSVYAEQEIDQSVSFDFDKFEVKPYKAIVNMQNKMYGGTWVVKRICEIEYVIYRVFGMSLTDIRYFLRKWIQKIRGGKV